MHRPDTTAISRFVSRTLLLVFAPLMTAAVPLSAAQVEPGRALSAFADSVRMLTEPSTLTLMLTAASGQRDVPISIREARKGWIAFRLGEIEQGRARLDEAVQYFDEAIYRNKSLANGWVGLAEAKLLLEQRGAVVKGSMHQSPGDYYEVAALRHLASAIRVQPNYPQAVALLSHLLIDFDAPDYPESLAESIRLAAAHPENGPIPQLLLGRYLRKERDLAGARRAFDEYAHRGGDAGVAGIEISRVHHLAGQPDSAVRTYLDAADSADSLGRAVLRRDLAWFASPEELQAFDRVPLDSVGRWIRTLWAARDAVALRPEGERLAEHLRRWWFVQDHFQLTGRRRGARFGWGVSGARHEINEENKDLGVWAMFEPGTLPESDPRALGVDDRGAIYMRHGEPASRVSAIASGSITGRSSGGCSTANESWKYDLPTGPIVLHFCASEALGTVGPTTLVSMLPLDPAIVGARSSLDLRFGLMELNLLQYLQKASMGAKQPLNMPDSAAKIPSDTTPQIAQRLATNLQIYGQASVKLGLTTDSYPLSYDRSLDPGVQIYGLGRSSGQGLALIIYALRGDRIVPETREGRLFYPIKMRVTAVDTAAGIIRSLDTLRLFVAGDTIPRDSYLYGMLEFPLPAGTYYIRTLLEQPGRSAAGAVGRPEVSVPGGPGHLTMSDLLPGLQNTGLTWVHHGLRVPLNPLNTYREGSSLELYYEIAGARPQGTYRIGFEFVRLTGRNRRGKNELTLGFREQARDSVMTIQRTIDLNELGVGTYVLTVSVTEEGTSRSVARQMTLNVLPR